jgi:chemotaxis protein methyltransferase CheR
LISEDRAFTLLKRRIFLDRGLDCEQYKENYLKRRLAVRMRATGAPDYLEYLNTLKKNPEEYTELLNELTVNVTEFFRDPDVYRKLAQEIIPRMIESKAAFSSKALRIWSAGCASGEEPYSIAILIDSILDAAVDGWSVRVLGSDYDDSSLKTARAAKYTELQVPDYIDPERYFMISRKGSTTTYQVRDEITRNVRFERSNLLEYEERRRYDMVLCRNVLIYFGREVQKKLISSLVGSIIGDGYLVLGKSETVGPEGARLLKPLFPSERIYQKLVEKKRTAQGVADARSR